MLIKTFFFPLLGLAAGCATAAEPMNQRAAVGAVLAARPDLAERLAGALPPTTLEAARGEGGGWNVAVLSWGSGRPGILAAECFAVASDGAVRISGQFRNRDLAAEIRLIDPASCSALPR